MSSVQSTRNLITICSFVAAFQLGFGNALCFLFGIHNTNRVILLDETEGFLNFF